MDVLLLLCFSLVTSCLGDDMTINGETVPYNYCTGPTYSSHDMGFVILIAAGAGTIFGFVFLFLVFILLCIYKPEYKIPVFGWKLKSLRYPILILSIILLVFGLPMLVTGAHYYHWSKLYDIRGNCEELYQVRTAEPIPLSALSTPVNLTIAYVSDSGAGENAIKVYQLVAAENAEVLVHIGDFDYCDDPTMFLKQINATLGQNILFLPVVGNQDLHIWGEYQEELLKRNDLSPTDDLQCYGTAFANYWCLYKGIFFAFSPVATKCGYGYSDTEWHEHYVETWMSDADTVDWTEEKRVWVNCAWHKTQRNLQLDGSRDDETGYNVYDICSKEGALILTGSDLSYGRTHKLGDVAEQQVVETCTSSNGDCAYNLTSGAVIAVVGTGGRELVDIDEELGALPHWASTYNQQNGALFCKYNFNGQEELTYCYFKTIDDNVIDEFYLTRNLGKAATSQQDAAKQK